MMWEGKIFSGVKIRLAEYVLKNSVLHLWWVGFNVWAEVERNVSSCVKIHLQNKVIFIMVDGVQCLG